MRKIGGNHSPVFVSTKPEKDFIRAWRWLAGTHNQRQLIIIADEKVMQIHSGIIESMLLNTKSTIVHRELLNASESTKQLDAAANIIHRWLSLPITRDTIVVCIGGGVITDLGGFIASVIFRGLQTVYIPTSLMAMTDASLGGKTAINAGFTKNQLGTIHLPLFTFVHPGFLESLPIPEIQSGFAEIFKHSLLESHDFCQRFLSGQIPVETVPHPNVLMRSIRVKMKLVQKDPFEKHQRLFLNLGHTFGHAIEALCLEENRPISHGHAVAGGLRFTLAASVKHAGFNAALRNKICHWLDANYPMPQIDSLTLLMPYLLKDKKSVSQGIRFVVLKAPGIAEIKVLSTNDILQL